MGVLLTLTYLVTIDPNLILGLLYAFSWVTLQVKKVINILIVKPKKKKKCCEYGCAFFRKSPYFTQNSLKREKQNVKDNFWDVCVSLPNLTCLYVTSPSMPIADNSQ